MHANLDDNQCLVGCCLSVIFSIPHTCQCCLYVAVI